MNERPTSATVFLGLLIAGLALLALHATIDLGGHGADALFSNGIYNVLMFGAALVVLARAIRIRAQRSAWLAMGIGVLSWSAGELYWSLFIEGTSAETYGSVSPADALFLAMYPCFYIAIGLLAKDHLHELRTGVWLDGLIAGLASATVASALILPPVIDHAHHHDLGSLTIMLAYPVGDLMLLMFAVGALGMIGRRPERVLSLIALSMLISAVADSAFLYQTATGSYRNGTLLDALWPAAAILIALAAWVPRTGRRPRALKSWQMMSVPTVALLSAVGVLAYGNAVEPLTPPVLILALATVLVMGAHLVLTLRENLALLSSSQQLSLTDPLTGLGNRRLLMRDLRAACDGAGRPWEFVLYDLDGFKLYNDAFGHPAGDTLLAQLSGRLKGTVEPHGTAYRVGGDEFCALFDDSRDARVALVERTLAALCEQGPGFSITASHGAVRIPGEAREPGAVMQLADQRLYRRKEELAAARAIEAEAQPALEESAAEESVDAEHGEHALASGQRDDGPLAGAASEQRAGHRRFRR